MENLKLQYMLNNGNYTTVDANRVEEFLTRAIARPQKTGAREGTKTIYAPMTRQEIIAKLQNGAELSIGSDWYAYIRSGSAYDAKMTARLAAQKPVEMVKCTCGHTIPRASVMSASLGTSCPDCYDRLSN